MVQVRCDIPKATIVEMPAWFHCRCALSVAAFVPFPPGLLVENVSAASGYPNRLLLHSHQ